jgi:hypothetical protein
MPHQIDFFIIFCYNMFIWVHPSATPFYMIGIDMKWNNFAEFAANNLNLGKFLDEQIGPVVLDPSVFPAFKDWVEKQVDYIVVRPWESLDLTSVDRRDVRHVAYYHVENEEGPGGRARYLNDHQTLEESLEAAVEWHGLYWALQPDRPLTFDAIVRKHISVGGNGYRREALEFFIAPPGFQPA